MTFLRTSIWMPLTGVLALVVIGLSWLMFGFAGNKTGMVALPDEAGSTVEMMADHGRLLTINDVESAPPSAWRCWPGHSYIWAGRGDAVWVRVTLHNSETVPMHGVLADMEYVSDRVDFWERQAPGPKGWRQARAGEAVRGINKTLWGRTAAFAVEVPAQGQAVVYLRGEDYFSVWMRLAWWPDQGNFHAAQVRDVLVEGVYYGALIALLFYNAVLWMKLNFTDIGYYVGYLSCMAAFIFTMNEGLGLMGVAVGSPGVEMLANGTLALSGVFLVQFARVFLELKTRVPWADRAAWWLRAVMIGLLAGTPFMFWMHDTLWLKLTVPAVTFTHASLLVMAVLAWRAGAGHARYFVLAFGLLFAGAFPAVVTWVENDTQKRAAMGLMAGSAMEMLLLSLAVADRFTRMQHEKNEAQVRLVEETEQRRAIQEAYADELEVEVRERTRDLEMTNADKDRMLTVLGHDLRSPLTGLTQMAEKLSATQASAPLLLRFAGDAARTGRQVLLLIEDLVLWSRLRTGMNPPSGSFQAAMLVTPVVALHRSLAEDRGIELSVEGVDGVEVSTDLVLAQTLVRNLVANALRVARRRVVIGVNVTEAGGARIFVRDDGPGLPLQIALALAAEAPETRLPDVGLGLRLCVEIGRVLGARVEAASVPGGGTELGFQLPALPPQGAVT